jgi:hypothetical protein
MLDGTDLPYADTEVSIDKSKNEINETLKRFGVRGIQWTWMDNRELLRFLHEFEVQGVRKAVAFEIQIPEIGKRTRGSVLVRNERQAYRVVCYVLKNRFVAIECGLKTFEEEFMSDIIYKLPNGSTVKVADVVLKQMENTKDIKLLEE